MFGPGTKLTVVGEIWTSPLLSADPCFPGDGWGALGLGAWLVVPLGVLLCKGRRGVLGRGTGEGYYSLGTRTEGKGASVSFFLGYLGTG